MKTPYTDRVQTSLFQLLILSGLLIFSGISSAENNLTNEPQEAPLPYEIAYQNGELMITLPHSDMTVLLDQLREERQLLTQESFKLQQVIDEKQFDKSDLLIMAIVPGGMIFSAIKRHQLKQAESDLTDINARYSDLTQDQLALELSSLETQIASNF